LVQVALEGAGKQEHWALPETLENSGGEPLELVHILSPFDPLIISASGRIFLRLRASL
jgi:hypothetical protein